MNKSFDKILKEVEREQEMKVNEMIEKYKVLDEIARPMIEYNTKRHNIKENEVPGKVIEFVSFYNKKYDELLYKYLKDINHTDADSKFISKINNFNIIFIILHVIGILQVPSFLPSMSFVYFSLFISLNVGLYYVVVFSTLKKQTEIYEYDRKLLYEEEKEVYLGYED